MHRQPHSAGTALLVADRLSVTLDRFLHIEAVSGIVLLVAASMALVWANSPWADSYHALWHMPVTFGVGSIVANQSLHFWINDGLMAIFFLVVGLEIRRELHEGALSNVRLATLPVAAALGGVIAPAIIFVLLNADPVAQRGWAVPTATDIAFAVGVLALLGKRIPPAVRVLLLAIAIIDDIAAILIIAFFYSSGIGLTGLAIAAAGGVLVYAWQWLGIRSAVAYVLPGAIVWIGLLEAGIHPTLAGVLLGLVTPVRPLVGRENPFARAGRALDDFRSRQELNVVDTQELVQPLKELQRAQLEMLPPVVRVQAQLHPWVAYGVMPLFALANAGVSFADLGIGDPASMSIILGIALGLVLGKPIGITLVSVLMVRLRFCELPPGVTWRGVFTVGCLGGIGFTMAIFIATLGFGDPAMLSGAKLAVLIASGSAAIIGLCVGAFTFRERPTPTA